MKTRVCLKYFVNGYLISNIEYDTSGNSNLSFDVQVVILNLLFSILKYFFQV